MGMSAIKLSGSTDGRGIKVAATGSPGTAVHTAISGTGADNFDELYLEVFNSHTADVVLTLEFGGTTAPDDNIVATIPPKKGLIPVVMGRKLQNGVAVKAFADNANKLVLFGDAIRMTP